MKIVRDRIPWQIIRKKHDDFLRKNPACEIVLSQMSDSRNRDISVRPFRNFLKILYLLLYGFIPKAVKRDDFHLGIFEVHLDRPNDWGLIWPLVLEMERRKVPYYFIVSEQCYEGHRKELLALTYGDVIRQECIKCKRMLEITGEDMLYIIHTYSRVKRIIKEFHLGTTGEYLDEMLTYMGYSNGLYKAYFSNARFSVSLGSRLFGFLYRRHGIRHFAVPHGDEWEDSVGYWTTLARGNVYALLTYGDYSANMYRKAFGSRCYPVGNVMLSGMRYSFRNNNKKIVFFSDSHAVTDSVVVDKEEIRLLNQTLDDLIRLQSILSGKYHISVKLHPNEKPDYICKYNKAFGSKIQVINGNVNSLEMLKESIIAISWGSTVNLEAVRMGVYSIQIVNIPRFGTQAYSHSMTTLDEVPDLLADRKRMEENFRYQQKIADEFIRNSLNVEKDSINLIFEKSGIRNRKDNRGGIEC